MASKVNIVINGKNLASKAIKDVTKDLSDAFGASNKFNDGMMKLAKFGLGSAIAAVGASLTASIASLKKSADFSDIRMQFDTLLGSYSEAEKMLTSLQGLAAKTPLQLTAVTEAATQLLAVGTDKNLITSELRMLGDLAMGNEQKFGLLTDAYAKLRAKGKVSLEELNRFTENGVPLLGELAKNLGVSNAELQKMVSSGKIKLKDIQQAMKDLTEEGGMFFGMMEKKSQGVNGKLSTLRDNLSMTMIKWGAAFEPLAGNLLDTAIQKLNEFSTSDSFKKFVETTVRWATWAASEIPKVGLTISLVGALIATTVQEAKEQLDKIGSFIIKTPVVQAVIEMAGDTWAALQKGFLEDDWSDLFGVGLNIFRAGLSILATVKLASIAGVTLWSGIQTALKAGGFSTALGQYLGIPGAIALASIVVDLVAGASGEKSWQAIGADMIAGLAAGMGITAFTGSPKAGYLAFSIVYNLELGSKLVGGPDFGPIRNELSKQYNSLNVVQRAMAKAEAKRLLKDGTDKEKAEALLTGTELGLNIVNGILGGMDQAKRAWTEYPEMVIEMWEKSFDINSPSKVMAEIGKFTILGFTQGMDKQMTASQSKISAIPQGLLDTFRDVLAVHSPSEETEEIGKWTAFGFIEGFGNMTFLEKLQALVKLYNLKISELGNVDAEAQAKKIVDQLFGSTPKPDPKTFSGFWDSFFDGIKDSYDESGLKSAIGSIALSAKTLFGGLLSGITNPIGSFFSNLMDKISNTGFGKFIGKAGNFVGGVADSVGQFFSSVTSKVANLKIGGATVGDRVGGAFEAIAPLLGKLGAGFASSISSLSSFKALLDPVSTILSGVMSVLEPIINKALAPLLGILTIIGKTIGGVLSPVFELLAAVTEIVGKAFVWFYNKAILPVGNGFITVFNLLYNAVAAVVNGIGNALKWLGVNLSMDYRSLDAGKLQAIDYSALTASASSYTGSSSAGGSSSSVNQVTVNYYQTINGNVIGDAGMANLGEFFVKAVEAYIGSGGTVRFIQETA